MKKIQEKNRGNIKETWKILNSITRNGSANHSYPDFFIDKDKKIEDMHKVVDRFNEFFC